MLSLEAYVWNEWNSLHLISGCSSSSDILGQSFTEIMCQSQIKAMKHLEKMESSYEVDSLLCHSQPFVLSSMSL